MRSIVSDLAYAGDYITPHEFNAEIAELGTVLNGLDRDNVDTSGPGGGLDHTKAAIGAWNVIEYSARTITQTTTHTDNLSRGVIYPIPDDVGDPWVMEIETSDGVLDLILSVAHHVTGPGDDVLSMFVGARIDGRLYRTPTHIFANKDGPFLDVSVPVPAGVHRIEAVYGSAHPASLSSDIDWLNGLMWARGVMR